MRKISPLFLLLLPLFLTPACGVKSWPAPMTSQNPPPPLLAVSTTAQGVEVSFTVPEAVQPDKVITQVIFKYAYLPLQDDPDCPACPPLLSSSRGIDLPDPGNGEKQNFVFIDTDAPYGQKAVYQAIWQDKAGRRSSPSALVYGYNLSLPPPPTEVQALSREDHRALSWQGLDDFSEPLFAGGYIGYMVERRGPDGIIRLNQRALTAASLNDYSVNPSRTYRYRVRSLRVLNEAILVMGQPSPWVKAAPFGRTSSLDPPGHLSGVSLPAGVYLRFEPVADPETKGYIIERRQEREDWQRISPDGFTENTFIDRQVKNGQYYEYRVTALDEEGGRSEPGMSFTVLYLPEEEAP
jgi:hypothetical protein